MPKLSLIITCHNQVELLERRVRRALTQSILGLEVIDVDDDSIESPDFVFEPFRSNARPRIIRKQNMSVANARNAVRDISGGKHLHFVGADDWTAPTTDADHEARYLDRRLSYYRARKNSMNKAQLHTQETAITTPAKNISQLPTKMAKSIHELTGIHDTVITTNSSLNKRIGESTNRRLIFPKYKRLKVGFRGSGMSTERRLKRKAYC